MITKLLFKGFSSMLLASTLMLAAGCGGGDAATESASNPEMAALEAKVAQGDAAAAMKLGEMQAAKVGNKDAQIEAMKWFHIASRLGHGEAGIALNAVQRGMVGDDVMEAELRAAAFKTPDPK